jgi:hypothetical protein
MRTKAAIKARAERFVLPLSKWAQLRNFAFHFIVCWVVTSLSLSLQWLSSRVASSEFKTAVLCLFWVVDSDI